LPEIKFESHKKSGDEDIKTPSFNEFPVRGMDGTLCAKDEKSEPEETDVPVLTQLLNEEAAKNKLPPHIAAQILRRAAQKAGVSISEAVLAAIESEDGGANNKRIRKAARINCAIKFKSKHNTCFKISIKVILRCD